MNSPRTDLENLIVLARRGQLDSGQVEDLDAQLQQRRGHADLYRWGRAFDLEDGVQPGDETLVARAVDGALRHRHARTWPKPRHRGWRHGAWLLAAVVVGFSASALGVAGYFSWRSERKSAIAPPPARATNTPNTPIKKRQGQPDRAATPPAAVASQEVQAVVANDPESERLSLLVSPTPGTALSAGSAEQRRGAPATSRAPTATLADDSTSPATAHDDSTSPATAHDDSTSPATAHEASPATAVELFASANAARRQGVTTLCVQRYRELQQRFPASPEARLSHVSLGKVLQARGEAAAAVREFTEYLKQPGNLEEEALVGRAAGLAQLGRAQEERESWQQLLTRFPGSVYAPRARARLAALGGT